MTWNPRSLPPAPERTFAVTGATAGLGYFAAEQLAATGARVVLVSRSTAKLDRARASIIEHVPQARLETVVIDLESLDSVARAGAALSTLDRLDGILLNGGVMTMPRGGTTADGLPILMGTHHLANAALTAAVLPALTDSARTHGTHSRIVHTSTGFVRLLRPGVDDLLRIPRLAVTAYTHAKTATEVFGFELDRRLRSSASPVQSLVVRPGVAVDAKTPHRAGIRDDTTPYQRNLMTPLGQGKDTGAWSAVRAMLDPSITGGDYIGPRTAFRGDPIRVQKERRTAEPAGDLAARIWTQTERLIGRSILVRTESTLR